MSGTYEPKIVDKPWGREVWYAHTDRYAGKILEVDAGHLLSLQKHVVKHETLYLLSGRMKFTRDVDVFEWRPGTAVEIPPDTVHRMEAVEDSVILEVSTPELDDVVRLEDRYGRTSDDAGGASDGDGGVPDDAGASDDAARDDAPGPDGA